MKVGVVHQLMAARPRITLTSASGAQRAALVCTRRDQWVNEERHNACRCSYGEMRRVPRPLAALALAQNSPRPGAAAQPGAIGTMSSASAQCWRCTLTRGTHRTGGTV